MSEQPTENTILSPAETAGWSECRLMQQICNKNPAGLSELVRRYEKCLRERLRSWGANPDDAEDVLQDLWVRFWRCPPASFDPDAGSLRAYLSGCAYRRWLDLLRSPQRRPMNALPDEHALVSGSPQPLEEICLNERAALINTAIGEFTPDEQRLVRLFLVEELSIADVAREVERPYQAVYRLILRLRQELIRRLRQRGNDLI
jgi:RNA polymerase sigma factor (sigma-70 family)